MVADTITILHRTHSLYLYFTTALLMDAHNKTTVKSFKRDSGSRTKQPNVNQNAKKKAKRTLNIRSKITLDDTYIPRSKIKLDDTYIPRVPGLMGKSIFLGRVAT